MARTKIALPRDISGVTITNPSAGQVLTYQDSSTVVNSGISIASLSDIDVDPVSDTNVLVYDSSVAKWVASTQQSWIKLPTCTYAASYQFTLSGDWTNLLTAGTKFKWGSTKYAYILSSTYSNPTTTVSLVPNNSQGSLDGTITNPCFSNLATPPGFPSKFSFLPTWASVSNPQPFVGPGGYLNSWFTVEGAMLHIQMVLIASAATTFGTGGWTFSLPAPAYGVTGYSAVGAAYIRKPANYNHLCIIKLTAGESSLATIVSVSTVGTNVSSLSSTVPMTWAANDYLDMSISYTIA